MFYTEIEEKWEKTILDYKNWSKLNYNITFEIIILIYPLWPNISFFFFKFQTGAIRKEEVSQLRMFQYLEGTVIFSWTIAPLLVSLGSFATFVLARIGTLDAQTAFVSLTLLNTLRGPLILLPLGIVSLIQGYVAVRRLNKWVLKWIFTCFTSILSCHLSEG